VLFFGLVFSVALYPGNFSADALDCLPTILVPSLYYVVFLKPTITVDGAKPQNHEFSSLTTAKNRKTS